MLAKADIIILGLQVLEIALAFLDIRQGNTVYPAGFLDGDACSKSDQEDEGDAVVTPEEQRAHQQFVRALQHEPIPCRTPGCSGSVEISDVSQFRDRVKTFEVRCQQCGLADRLTGVAQQTPPWDEASLLVMADEHLMHQQPSCPCDGTPVVFTSLPNPRRRARYRVSCFYCGRQAEMDWPPPESRR